MRRLRVALVLVAAVLADGENRVRRLHVPDELVRTNTVLADALVAAAQRIWAGPLRKQPVKDACGNAAYWAAVDREDVNAAVRSLEPQLRTMADQGFPVPLTVAEVPAF